MMAAAQLQLQLAGPAPPLQPQQPQLGADPRTALVLASSSAGAATQIHALVPTSPYTVQLIHSAYQANTYDRAPLLRSVLLAQLAHKNATNLIMEAAWTSLVRARREVNPKVTVESMYVEMCSAALPYEQRFERAELIKLHGRAVRISALLESLDDDRFWALLAVRTAPNELRGLPAKMQLLARRRNWWTFPPTFPCSHARMQVWMELIFSTQNASDMERNGATLGQSHECTRLLQPSLQLPSADHDEALSAACAAATIRNKLSLQFQHPADSCQPSGSADEVRGAPPLEPTSAAGCARAAAEAAPSPGPAPPPQPPPLPRNMARRTAPSEVRVKQEPGAQSDEESVAMHTAAAATSDAQRATLQQWHVNARTLLAGATRAVWKKLHGGALARSQTASSLHIAMLAVCSWAAYKNRPQVSSCCCSSKQAKARCALATAMLTTNLFALLVCSCAACVRRRRAVAAGQRRAPLAPCCRAQSVCCR